jgi:hypothetical protein
MNAIAKSIRELTNKPKDFATQKSKEIVQKITTDSLEMNNRMFKKFVLITVILKK